MGDVAVIGPITSDKIQRKERRVATECIQRKDALAGRHRDEYVHFLHHKSLAGRNRGRGTTNAERIVLHSAGPEVRMQGWIVAVARKQRGWVSVAVQRITDP